MTIPLEKIKNQFALIENNYLNFYNITLTDESLGKFLLEFEKISFLKGMINVIGIKENQQINKLHKDMLKAVFINWNGEFRIEK
jgi:hypothetical protein